MTYLRALVLCLCSLTACLKDPGHDALAIRAPYDLNRSYAHLPDQTSLRIAFGSCLRQDKSAPIFDAIKRSAPDLFLMVGDNIYAEIEGSDFTPVHTAYRRLWSRLTAVDLGVPIAAVLSLIHISEPTRPY